MVDYEIDPHTFSEVQIRVAQGCMSQLRFGALLRIHPFQLALYDDKAQKEVYGDDPDTLVSSSYAPLGQVEVVDGGFKLSGHWQWSSGSEHCEMGITRCACFLLRVVHLNTEHFCCLEKIMKLMTPGIQWDSKLPEAKMS